MPLEDFYTRQRASEGVKLPLYFPDGSLSDEWIKVRGIDSDAFRLAESAAKKKAAEITLMEKEEEKAEAMREAELECIASLVAEWSFDKELTPETVLEFLREAPQITDQINRFAASRAQFYRKK